MLWNADKRRSAQIRVRYITGLLITTALVAFVICNSQRSVTAEKEPDTAALIDTALYTRHEFFGAQAIVPYPTAEARNRLAEVLKKYPDNAQIYLKLSQLDEKLGNEELALQEMQAFVEHESIARAAHLHRRVRTRVDALQESGGIRPEDFDLAQRGNVDQARAFAHRSNLLLDALRARGLARLV